MLILIASDGAVEFEFAGGVHRIAALYEQHRPMAEHRHRCRRQEPGGRIGFAVSYMPNFASARCPPARYTPPGSSGLRRRQARIWESMRPVACACRNCNIGFRRNGMNEDLYLFKANVRLADFRGSGHWLGIMTSVLRKGRAHGAGSRSRCR